MADIEQAFQKKWNRKYSFKTVLGVLLEQTQKDKEDVLQLVVEKQKDLGGLISEMGAICIVAKELGVELFY